jgi:hypothetical protein
MTNWKSTVSGILSFIMATAGVLTAFAAAQLAANPTQNAKLYAYITGACTLASGLGKAWIGLLTTDADKLTNQDIANQTSKAAATPPKPGA